MEDVPQPAPESYDIGDGVRVYLDPDDPDSQYHGVKGVVIDRFEDSLSEHTGREIDQYTYRVRKHDTGEILPVEFRHRDLVSD